MYINETFESLVEKIELNVRCSAGILPASETLTLRLSKN